MEKFAEDFTNLEDFEDAKKFIGGKRPGGDYIDFNQNRRLPGHVVYVIKWAGETHRVVGDRVG